MFREIVPSPCGCLLLYKYGSRKRNEKAIAHNLNNRENPPRSCPWLWLWPVDPLECHLRFWLKGVCPAGNYRYAIGNSCHQCPVGQYQSADEHILETCEPCPVETTTSKKGATLVDDCNGMYNLNTGVKSFNVTRQPLGNICFKIDGTRRLDQCHIR